MPHTPPNPITAALGLAAALRKSAGPLTEEGKALLVMADALTSANGILSDALEWGICSRAFSAQRCDENALAAKRLLAGATAKEHASGRANEQLSIPHGNDKTITIKKHGDGVKVIVEHEHPLLEPVTGRELDALMFFPSTGKFLEAVFPETEDQADADESPLDESPLGEAP